MLKSMTGYGRAKCFLENQGITVEIKSVNHRNLEIIVRLPNIFNALEPEIRKKISEKLVRGRIEVTIRTDTDPGRGIDEKLVINLPLIRNYCSLLNQVRTELNMEGEVTLPIIASFRDAFYYQESEVNLKEIWQHLEKALTESIDSLTEMREKEGELLTRDFIMRYDIISGLIHTVKLRSPQVVADYKKRLSERVRELTDDLEIDDIRLSQEVALMAEKSDITEEIVRFESHLSQFREIIESEGAAGRKMDFILQELYREINTIGSKSSDIEISRSVIEIKSELAKVREQAQNVE